MRLHYINVPLGECIAFFSLHSSHQLSRIIMTQLLRIYRIFHFLTWITAGLHNSVYKLLIAASHRCEYNRIEKHEILRVCLQFFLFIFSKWRLVRLDELVILLAHLWPWSHYSVKELLVSSCGVWRQTLLWQV